MGSLVSNDFLYFVATVVAGEQTGRPRRLSVLPVKSIIVWIAWQHLTYAKARRSIIKQYERRRYVSISMVLEIP
jgi:hypothetical protein